MTSFASGFATNGLEPPDSLECTQTINLLLQVESGQDAQNGTSSTNSVRSRNAESPETMSRTGQGRGQRGRAC